MKDNLMALDVLESWRKTGNFDDLAFANAVRDKRQVMIKKIERT